MYAGAGRVERLCGLVDGVLMFVGLWGSLRGCPRRALQPLTVNFSRTVEQHFGSTLCRDLRREAGCGSLATESLAFAAPWLSEALQTVRN